MKISPVLKVLSISNLVILFVASLLIFFGTTNLAGAQTKVRADQNFRITFQGTAVDPSSCSRTGAWAAAGVGAGPTSVQFPAFSFSPGIYNFAYTCRSLPSSSQGGAVIATPNVSVEILATTIGLEFTGTGSTNPYFVPSNLTFNSSTGNSANTGETYTLNWNFTGSYALNGGSCRLTGPGINATGLGVSGSRTIRNGNSLCQEEIPTEYTISCTAPGLATPVTSSVRVTHFGRMSNCVPM